MSHKTGLITCFSSSSSIQYIKQQKHSHFSSYLQPWRDLLMFLDYLSPDVPYTESFYGIIIFYLKYTHHKTFHQNIIIIIIILSSSPLLSNIEHHIFPKNKKKIVCKRKGRRRKSEYNSKIAHTHSIIIADLVRKSHRKKPHFFFLSPWIENLRWKFISKRKFSSFTRCRFCCCRCCFFPFWKIRCEIVFSSSHHNMVYIIEIA